MFSQKTSHQAKKAQSQVVAAEPHGHLLVDNVGLLVDGADKQFRSLEDRQPDLNTLKAPEHLRP